MKARLKKKFQKEFNENLKYYLRLNMIKDDMFWMRFMTGTVSRELLNKYSQLKCNW